MWIINLLPLLRNNWKIIFAFVSFLLWSIGCYHQGAKSVQAKWDNSVVEAKENARKIESDNNIVSNIIGEKYETGIKSIDDNFNSAIAGMPAASVDMSRATNSPCKPNAATSRNSVYQENKRLRLELARQAEINTQRLISLQEWERKIK